MIATLPTTYYESLAGLRHLYVSAVCTGVRRSATTLVYQFVRDCFPEGGVVKTHHYLDVPPSVPIVLTIRDFRDCAVSWWRTVAGDEERHNAEVVALKVSPCGSYRLAAIRNAAAEKETLSVDTAIRIAGIIKQDVYHVRQYIERRPDALLLRYEDFVDDISKVGRAIEVLCERSLPEESFAKHSLRANWGLQKFTDIPIPTWNANAAKSALPNGHCHEGIAGSWRKHCTSIIADLLTEVLHDELLHYGYITEPKKEVACESTTESKSAAETTT